MTTTNKLAVGAALFALAMSLGGPAIANAFPSESVRNGYADCVNKVSTTDSGYDANVKKCCLDYGGTYKDGPNGKGCTLPDATPANSTSNGANSLPVQPDMAPVNPPTKSVPKPPRVNVSDVAALTS